MMNKMKWGVLGYARIAQNSFIPSLLKASNSELSAIATTNPDKAAEIQKLHPLVKTYSFYQSLLEDPEIEAVYVPLPNHLHKEWAIKAMQMGKHVLCEKPIALNSRECHEMMEASSKSGVQLMEAFMYRYTDRTQKTLDLIRQNAIGTLTNIHASFQFFLGRPDDYRFNPAMGGGSLYDVGCYPIDYFGLLLNSSPVSCCCEFTEDQGVDVLCGGTLRYENGVICTFTSAFNSFFHSSATIIGKSGIIEVPETFQGDAGQISLITDEGKKYIPVKASDRYRMEIEDFAEAARTGRKPGITMDESLRNIQIIEGMLLE